MATLSLSATRKQLEFIKSSADEVLYGGAAGGGKSYGQVLDALLYALKYPKSKQLILRRTYPELEQSIIRTAQEVFPRDLWRYNKSSHTGTFTNGSIIDFGHCGSDDDVTIYQGAEFDVVRFDELTHFTEYQYLYLLSRVRGANGYPKQIKSSTNPGGVGHTWVKARWIDRLAPNEIREFAGRTYQFIPAKVQDNPALMENDPEYLSRLEALPEAQKKALLYGEWNIFEGQFFPEFSYETHTCEPFSIPREWRRYRAIDYGLDCFACCFFAISPAREIYLYDEIAEPNRTISEAARMALERTGAEIYCTFAPPDLWGRSQETGRGRADIFAENGLKLVRASNDREDGWASLRELLAIQPATGEPRLKIFRSCKRIIHDLPALIIDPKRPSDCLTEPHEITHVPDAARYFAVQWTRPVPVEDAPKRRKWSADMLEDYYNASPDQQKILKERWGDPA